jgi:hypothetical protein
VQTLLLSYETLSLSAIAAKCMSILGVGHTFVRRRWTATVVCAEQTKYGPYERWFKTKACVSLRVNTSGTFGAADLVPFCFVQSTMDIRVDSDELWNRNDCLKWLYSNLTVFMFSHSRVSPGCESGDQ